MIPRDALLLFPLFFTSVPPQIAMAQLRGGPSGSHYQMGGGYGECCHARVLGVREALALMLDV